MCSIKSKQNLKAKKSKIMKITYIFSCCIAYFMWVMSLQAQISGFKGKSSAISLVTYFSPIRFTSTNYYLSSYPSMRPSIQINYETAFNRQQSFVIQARYHDNKNVPIGERYIVHPLTSENVIAQYKEDYSITQFGIEYATYKKRNWALAPIGKSVRWGFHLNRMAYNLEDKVENFTRATKGAYLFPSLSWQFNNRVPIAPKISFNMGIGLELPLGFWIPFQFRKDIENQDLFIPKFRDVMLRSVSFSRLINVGISYHL
jgi:hypothetical protein